MYEFCALTEKEIQHVAENLSDGNKNELALHLGVKEVTPEMAQKALTESLRECALTFKVFVPDGRLCGIGGISKAGSMTFVIVDGLKSDDYICLLRDARPVLKKLKENRNNVFCWADSRNVRARRWFNFAGLMATGANFTIYTADGDAVDLNYYEYSIPLAE